jgi:hypothetical protein
MIAVQRQVKNWMREEISMWDEGALPLVSSSGKIAAKALIQGRMYINIHLYECYGTMLSFKYNSYRVAEADTDALRRDERPFAVVLLAAALMLEAGSDPNDREKYARSMRDDGLSIETIKKYTGLSESEILGLPRLIKD